MLGCSGGGTSGTGLPRVLGRLVAVDETPVSSVLVTAFSGASVLSTTTDQDGSFEFSLAVTEGEIRFVFEGDSVNGEVVSTDIPTDSSLIQITFEASNDGSVAESERETAEKNRRGRSRFQKPPFDPVSGTGPIISVQLQYAETAKRVLGLKIPVTARGSGRAVTTETNRRGSFWCSNSDLRWHL